MVWAELDQQVVLTDSRFHSWPYGMPGTTGTDPAVFYGQRAATRLKLADAQARSKGAGVLVAVLDTGADTAHPVLAGRTVPGWNYVDDSARHIGRGPGGGQRRRRGAGRRRSGTARSSADWSAWSRRGRGSCRPGCWTATASATRSRWPRPSWTRCAPVPTSSTSASVRSEEVDSKVVAEALRIAENHKVVVISAAGNTRSTVPHFPASAATVCGVAALGSGSQLAFFSNRGPWVEVAAPGDQLVGPMPGGGYAVWSGSSMSSALVSGQAALLRALDPEASAGAIIDDIEATARRVPTDPIESGSVDIPRSLDHTLS